MSGIVGCIGHMEAKPLILDTLERLEYRGYDSAGLAIIANNQKLTIQKSLGRTVNLAEKLEGIEIAGSVGLGHTRWAANGKPSIRNAHPHRAGGIAVVHNGRLDNDDDIRAELQAAGVRIKSETDTELIAILINRYWKGNLLDAVLKAMARLEGSITCAVISEDEPNSLVAVRRGNPLVVGLGDGQQIVASDATAIAPYTNRMVFMKDGDVALLTHEGTHFMDMDGKPVHQSHQLVSWSAVRAEKMGYRHFLLKEITESPRAVRDTIGDFVPLSHDNINPDEIKFPHHDLASIKRLIFVGSGSSHAAAMYGGSIASQVAGIPSSTAVASEFRYSNSVIDEDAAYVMLSQSGESLDTLESARMVQLGGGKVVGITNSEGSSLARLADYPLITRSGPEVSVASSKTFSATIIQLLLLAYYIGKENGFMPRDEQIRLLGEILSIPEKMELTIAEEVNIRRLSQKYIGKHSFFFVGRQHLYPVAKYASLMMKEVVNLHGEGLLAGEIKHGAISLIEHGTPVMFFGNQRAGIGQLLNDMDELRARGADLIATGAINQKGMLDHCDYLINTPVTDDLLAPLLAIVPAQLFNYYLGLYNRKDVDRPRNIAKSVTV